MTNPQDVVKQVRKYTRKKFIPDEKIRIVLEGLRGEVPITDLCRREGIASAAYYKWSKEFLEAGKNGLTRASLRNATTDEVKNLKDENSDLKRAVAELTLGIMKYKKSLGM
jgi:transposase